MNPRKRLDCNQTGRIMMLAAVVLWTSAAAVSAQSLGEFDRRLNELEPRVGAGVTDPQVASDVIDELDQAETEFARIAESERTGRSDLTGA
jgi:hypothetical protein